MVRCLRLGLAAYVLLAFAHTGSAQSVSNCEPDGVQDSGSIYRICMPTGEYNGSLVIWAHGYQDATEPVGIPESQVCGPSVCLPELANGLGFGFATNSYRKTGMAILEGKADLLDLVNIYTAKKGKPTKVYLIGASEGGIITALSLERHPDVYAGGVAACGPVGNFPFQINFFGDARITFQYFFPDLIPGDPFHPTDELVNDWGTYYDTVVKPFVFDPANRHLLDQWVKVAQLPFDTADYLGSLELSVHDALRYPVVNINDVAETIGGFPFDNRYRWYFGSDNDLLLNIFIQRVAADDAALTAMDTDYATTGKLTRPLITLHTLKDQQVPYFHEQLYDLKTLFAGTWLTRHINFPVDRFGHCNFTEDEALVSFATMLFYDGLIDLVSGLQSAMTPAELSSFETRARAAGLPTERAGAKLAFRLKKKP
jgi:pimeloyl-ACP methyl ester carboxylesterase